MLTKCTDIPKTSQITMMRFEEQFEAYLAAGIEDVLYVSINSGGSNTHSAALMARQNFLKSAPRLPHAHHHCGQPHLFHDVRLVCVRGRQKAGGRRRYAHGGGISGGCLCPHGGGPQRVYAEVHQKSGRISAAAAFAGELLACGPSSP